MPCWATRHELTANGSGGRAARPRGWARNLRAASPEAVTPQPPRDADPILARATICSMGIRTAADTNPSPGGSIRLVRVYGASAVRSGASVLVDRVWPRGLRKEDLRLDRWMREIAPSDELRHWFGHRPERWPEFQERYRRELAGMPQQELLVELLDLARRGSLTLLYGARDEERNQAVVLRQVLLERIQSEGDPR